MKLKDFLNQLDEGYDNPGVQDGTGPYKNSARGEKGPGKGKGRGNCPKREEYDSKEEYEKALKKWKEKNEV